MGTRRCTAALFTVAKAETNQVLIGGKKDNNTVV